MEAIRSMIPAFNAKPDETAEEDRTDLDAKGRAPKEEWFSHQGFKRYGRITKRRRAAAKRKMNKRHVRSSIRQSFAVDTAKAQDRVINGFTGNAAMRRNVVRAAIAKGVDPDTMPNDALRDAGLPETGYDTTVRDALRELAS